jgi:hypothetical protein
MRHALALIVVPALALAACGGGGDTTTIKGDNGETVTIETDKQADGTTRMEATSETGEKVTANIGADGSSWPADAPAYAPAYPGATISAVMSSDAGGTKGSVVTFETSDPAAKVVAHYKALATGAGLGETGTMTSGATSLFTAADKDSGREFMVQATTTDGKTTGSLTFATRTPA